MYVFYVYNKTNLPQVDDFCLEDVCGDSGDFNSNQLLATILPAGKVLYPDDQKLSQSDEIYYAKLYYNADVIISIQPLKIIIEQL